MYTVILTLALILFIFSAGVAVPLVWRGFYYMQINGLHLTETTPWSYDQIREAYDQMMDFCMFGKPFGTGVLKWSESGMQHFADCRVLFMLDIRVLIGSFFTSGALLLQWICGKTLPKRVKGKGPFFFAGVIPAIVFVGLSALVAFTDFDAAFVKFHQMFFPGKSNWIFNPWEDEIICVLPEVFFMNCAILIVAVIVLLSVISIILDKKIK